MAKGSLLLLFILLGRVFGYFGGVYYSAESPGGLDPQNIPMFINLGFDDNRYADGVDWVLDELLAGRYNNQGIGNKATFDGTPMAVSFYVIGNVDLPWSEDPFNQPIPDERPVTDAFRRAYDAGMGIGNHTWTHQYNLYDLSENESIGGRPSLYMEIGTCSKYLVNIMGMPVQHIYGFRTPYLANSLDGSSFKVTRDLGILYDCTLNNSLQGSRPAEWTRADFPGRMDNGWTAWGRFPVDNFWQFPNATYPVTEGGTFSDMGFDSGPNGWPGGASATAMFNQMKWAIQYHYETNRAPIDLGLHSDYYSQEAQNTPGSGASQFTTPLNERRRALVMLLDWIEEELPDARVVTKIDAIRWLTNPVALDDLSRNDELTFSDASGSGVLANIHTITDGNGSTAEIIDPLSLGGNGTVNVTVQDPPTWRVESYAGVVYPLKKNMSEVHSVRVTYSSDLPLRLVLVQDGLGMGSYGKGLPSTNGEVRVVELPVIRDYFELPRPYQSNADLDLSAVTEVALVAQVFDTTMSGTFIPSVEFFGAGQLSDEVSVASTRRANVERTFRVESSTRSGVSISVPYSGLYNVTLYNFRGQRVTQLNQNLTTGKNLINFGNVSPGSYILRIEGRSGTHTARFMIK
ncbi:chitin deacetylase [Chitinispirillum alkaliphilum]|nr:chitin deacetylase [Chitinispirillum alkaliphilum]